MSVKVMGLVWDLRLARDLKYILLAYADHADPKGNRVYPSVNLIAFKTGYSERSVQYLTRELERLGLLEPDGSGVAGTNRWRIPIERFVDDGQGGVQFLHPAESAPPQKKVPPTRGGVQGAAPEPSLTGEEEEDSEATKFFRQIEHIWDDASPSIKDRFDRDIQHARLDWGDHASRILQVIGVPSGEGRWLAERLGSTIQKALTGVLGFTPEIQWIEVGHTRGQTT